MCGIAGIVTTRADLDLAALLESMRSSLEHRGPDDSGSEVVELPNGVRLGLAQTRLAIQDLTAAAHQPMVDPETGSRIVYNGEIYNHGALRRSLPARMYQSSGDTETILAGWIEHGEAFLSSLRGMFAFGVYDARRADFWLVRDRLGVKPLYVTRVDGRTWLFASEVRALLATGLVERQLNTSARDSYLAFGSVIAPWTLVDGVESLMPGESWRIDLDRLPLNEPIHRRYWRLPFQPTGDDCPTRDEAVESLRPVLAEAIGLRMLSDVPVGVFLSGGIDSSAVVASLAAQGRDVTTLSVAFEERSHDESAYARLIARHFGTRHVELLLRADQILAEFDDALAAYDQPSVDGLNSYFVSQTAREAGIPVALSGLGGDELFAGYPGFRYAARAEQTRWRPVASIAMAVVTASGGRSRRLEKLAALLNTRSTRLEHYLAQRTLIRAGRRSDLVGLSRRDMLPEPVARELNDALSGLDAVNAQSLLELALYTANTLLRDTDQMSMAHALEVRVPLLDHELVEAAAQIPGSLKLIAGRQSPLKGLLVDALPTPLPQDAVRRRKMGFVLPWDRWLRGELRDAVWETLSDRASLDAAGLNADAVALLWNEFLNGHPEHRAADVLSLVNLLRWVRRHQMSLSTNALQPFQSSRPMKMESRIGRN